MTLLGLSLLTALWAADHAYDAEDANDEAVVAAVAYTGNTPPDGNFECEELASTDIEEELCEVEILVREAADQGARIVVLSEGSFEIEDPEGLPRKGRLPDPELSPILAAMSNLAAELQLYLVVPIHTLDHSGQTYTSLIAFGPRGRTVGVHHKIELYSTEHEEFLPGTRFGTFETPWGRVAMMLCSDLYAEPELHLQMVARSKAKIVALSSLWTVEEATRWQAAIAHDWGIHVIAANGAGGTGKGSGIYKPDGTPLTSDDSGLDAVLVASLHLDR